ncbi:MAG: arginine--tRNA ligase [Nitrospirae bacterium]|nr:arginine--tRNA ligase [Nitrospirota bacterium]
MKDKLAAALIEAIEEAGFPRPEADPLDLVDLSRDRKFGDWSSNAAFHLAKAARKNPREVASKLAEGVSRRIGAEKAEIAGAGFLNLRLPRKAWHQELWRAYAQGDRVGHTETLAGRRVLLEFVSANPTGPLHVGHGRNAAIGDALGRALAEAGAEVRTEYYVNDVGGQMETLCASVAKALGVAEAKGMAQREDGEMYAGEYVDSLAEVLKGEPSMARRIDELRGADLPWPSFVDQVSPFLAGRMLEAIRHDLADFRVGFHSWFHESRLKAEGKIEGTIEKLKERGLAYENEGALWFRSTQFGDEKDRVLVRETGAPTYFASDAAYHALKAAGGWDALINIWGADHHGYIPRVRGALAALDADPRRLDVILVQMVSLLRDGQRVEMSKRKGTYVTLREILDEVGPDVARFFYLMREPSSHLDFDLDLARTQSEKNPVYYVQYAHARVASLMAHAGEKGLVLNEAEPRHLETLQLEEELELIRQATYFPWVVAGAARAREPHRIPFYLIELVRLFHQYYNLQRIVTEDRAASLGRLVLCRVFGTVVRRGLDLIGVSAPDKM